MLTHIRFAVRRLVQAPAFTLAAMLTLATAIAANSAVFSAVYAVLLAPTPITEPDRIVVTWQADNRTNGVAELTHRHWREWTASGRVFESASLMGSHNWSGILEGRGEPTRVWFNGVSSTYFDVLGVRPVLGRAFTADDDLPTSRPVVVLNYGSWQRRFGGDPNIVGQSLQLDGTSTEIIGVMPEGLDLPRDAEFWMPIVPILSGGDPKNVRNLDLVGVSYVVGRLRPGIDVVNAAAQLDEVERQLDAATPARPKWGDRVVAKALSEHVFGPTRAALWALWGAVTVLLLVACANVSGLLLTRVAQRQREHALKTALGATRVALMRAWFAEVIVVSVAGGAVGFAAAGLLTRVIVALAPADLPRFEHVSINWTVAAFTALVVVGVAVIVAFVPMRQTRISGLAEALGSGARTAGDRRSTTARSTLLVVQLALAVLLMVAAGLVLRSFEHVRDVDLGFEPDRVITMSIEPRSIAQAPNEWMRQVVERVSTVEGVRDVGNILVPPLALGPIGHGARIVLEGQPQNAEGAAKNPAMNYQAATPGYLPAMSMRVLRGRWFNEADTAQAPRVSVVSESAARALWPGEDPLGKRVFMSAFTPGKPSVWRTIVGVVNDVRYRGIGEVQFDIYDPAAQVGQFTPYLVVRAAGDPSMFVSAIREHVRALDQRAVVDGVQTLDAVVSRAAAPWRFATSLFALLAGVSIALACVGLFSVIALDVQERRHEFAVRLALGASGRSILRGVLTRAAVRVAAGLVAGLAAAALSTTMLQSVLFEISPHDPGTYVIVAVAVLAVVLAAALVPARRATTTSPGLLLR